MVKCIHGPWFSSISSKPSIVTGNITLWLQLSKVKNSFEANTGREIMSHLLLACDPEELYSMCPLHTSLSVSHQIAKQMDAALRGLNGAPDIKVKFSSVYLMKMKIVLCVLPWQTKFSLKKKNVLQNSFYLCVLNIPIKSQGSQPQARLEGFDSSSFLVFRFGIKCKIRFSACMRGLGPSALLFEFRGCVFL